MKLSDLKIENKNSTHYICKCPECDKSKSPKLYVDKKLGKFICFRCGLHGTLEGYEFSALVSGSEPIKEKKNTLFDLSLLKKVSENLESKYYKYLISRKMSHEDIILSSIREYNMFGKPCIIIPNVVENELTNYIQVRFLEGDFRWYNITDVNKPLFCKQFLTNESTLVIAEGFFTAFSINRIPGFDSIAIVGKYLSDFQTPEFIKLAVKYKKVIIALDEDTFSETLSLYNQVKNILLPYDVNVSRLHLKNVNGDFNDFSLEESIEILNSEVKGSYSDQKFINFFKSNTR